MRGVRRSSTGRASPPILLTSVPAGRLPASTPATQARRAAASPPFTPRRHRLHLRELREPLPQRAVVPRLQPTLPAPRSRRDLPQLSGSRHQRGTHRRPKRRHAELELSPGRQPTHHEEVSAVSGEAQTAAGCPLLAPLPCSTPRPFPSPAGHRPSAGRPDHPPQRVARCAHPRENQHPAQRQPPSVAAPGASIRLPYGHIFLLRVLLHGVILRQQDRRCPPTPATTRPPDRCNDSPLLGCP